MKNQSPQGGAIVNTASMAAHAAPPNMVAYASSKAAVMFGFFYFLLFCWLEIKN